MGMWINLGGLALLIVLFVELRVCIAMCWKKQSPDPMMNMLCFVVAGDSGYEVIGYFWAYRGLSHYLFMILISIFAAVDFESVRVPSYEHRNALTFGNDFGLFLFVWAWTAGIISHCSFVFVMAMVTDEGSMETTRDIVSLLKEGQVAEAEQLYLFGIPMPSSFGVGFRGNNVLHDLCRYGGVDSMDWIKRICQLHPEYINAQDDVGRIPMWYACYANKGNTEGREQIIEYLIEQGADTSEKMIMDMISEIFAKRII